MQRRARIQISGDRKAIQDQWNSRHPQNPMIAGALSINATAPDYRELKDLYAEFSAAHRVTWNEAVEVVYEDKDLECFEILTLWITGSAGNGGNKHGPVYDEIRNCPVCGEEKLGRQLRPPILDPAEVGDSDLAVTDFGEVICSSRFVGVLDGTPGVGWQTVEWLPASTPQESKYQLMVAALLGPLAPSFPLVREGRCEVCGEYRHVGIDAPTFSELRQLRFPRSSYQQFPIALTQERFGGTRKFPLIIVSQSMYRQIRQQRMTGFWFEPAHLE